MPDVTQKQILLRTMESFNAAASFASQVGFSAGVFSQPSIHKLCYAELRERFNLSAQMAVRAIGKAVEVFRRDKSRCPVFKSYGAVTYDERILSFKGLDRVSLWAFGGRMIVPLIYGAYQSQRFDRIKGQTDLVYRKGQFFLYATIDLPDTTPVEVGEFLGVDLGIAQLATDSDGNNYSGEAVEKIRRRHHRNRQSLQRKGTQGAKKRLSILAGREAAFRRHHNHCISKAIVQCAKDTSRVIAVEELTGIRERVTVRRKDRAQHSGWSFFQLRAFLEYKAALLGIPVIAVDPRNTSRTCSACGHCEKANRVSQSEFKCRHCDYSTNADFNAARNIAARGISKLPSKLVSLTA
jgi:IS605 OrfB family transposase